VSFGQTVLTEKGLALQTKAQTGTPLNFTRIAIGDGHVPDRDSLRRLTALVHETMELPILELKIIGEGQTHARTMLSNENLTTGMYIREIGLFAEDPDEGEILYCVANAGDLADYLPAFTSEPVEQIFTLITVIGEAQNVTAVIASQANVTVAQFQDHVQDTTVHITRQEYEQDLDALRSELNLIKATLPDSFTHNLFEFKFTSLKGIKLIRGYYNEAQGRIEV